MTRVCARRSRTCSTAASHASTWIGEFVCSCIILVLRGAVQGCSAGGVRQALKDVLYGRKPRLDAERWVFVLAAGSTVWGRQHVALPPTSIATVFPDTPFNKARTHMQTRNTHRLVRMADGFSAFTTDGLSPTGQQPAAAASSPKQQQERAGGAGSSVSGSGANSSSGGQQGPALDPAVREALLLVFSKEGSYVQVRPAGAAALTACDWTACSQRHPSPRVRCFTSRSCYLERSFRR